MSQNPPTPAIPMVDLRPLHDSLRPGIDDAIGKVLERGDFIGGNALSQFERQAAAFLGVEYAFGVGSGTDALSIALRVAGVGPGDEVITSPFTFWATAEAIHSVGARAVYVDIDPLDMNLDPAGIEAAVSERTKAILLVHIFGQCADMAGVMELARAHGLAVIEDAAQAFGARYQQASAGSFGLAGCFSFYPSKPLGCMGDGGLITTNDGAFAEQLRLFNNHGAYAHNHHSAFGQGSRLDTVQAAILLVKLAQFSAHLEARRQVARNYAELLAPIPVELPHTLEGRDHCFAQFTIRCDNRDALKDHLARAGVASAIHYPLPMYRQAANAGDYAGLYLPNAETCSARCLSLPLYQGLSYSEQVTICERIGEFFR